jgi:serine/threonine protein kinase
MPFIFLEYEAGGDLNAWIALKNASRDLPEALRLAVGFCDGINYVYSKGIKAHRDIKPGNCLISANGDLKITDFGLASVLVPTDFTSTANRQRTSPEEQAHVSRLTEVGLMLGTIPYMAPEQTFDASNVDARADIYSFGIMLFKMLTGTLPFVGRNAEEWVNFHRRIPVPSLDRSFPEDLNQLIQECTAKMAEKRPDFESVRKRLASAYSVITDRELPLPQASLPHSNQLMRKGIGLAHLGETNAALSFFERSLRIDPNNASAWLNKSYVLSSLGREDEALLCAD